MQKSEIFEIIETYWNVNFSPGRPSRTRPGNNRNILECKFVKNWGAISEWFEIIETYWNVNSGINTVAISDTSEIIETYWNVNLLVFKM